VAPTEAAPLPIENRPPDLQPTEKKRTKRKAENRSETKEIKTKIDCFARCFSCSAGRRQFRRTEGEGNIPEPLIF
jgi:hypothetical protein